MKKRLLLASTTLVVATGVGNLSTNTLIANSSTEPLLAHESPGRDQRHEMRGEEIHEHKTMEIPAGQPIPSVDLIVHPDALRGWNLEVEVSNFQFAPEKINQKSNPKEGHAHLYIDGKKLTRLYGSWYYLDSLTPGKHKISVTLNSNGHEELVHNGQIIQDTEIIEAKATNN